MRGLQRRRRRRNPPSGCSRGKNDKGRRRRRWNAALACDQFYYKAVAGALWALSHPSASRLLLLFHRIPRYTRGIIRRGGIRRSLYRTTMFLNFIPPRQRADLRGSLGSRDGIKCRRCVWRGERDAQPWIRNERDRKVNFFGMFRMVVVVVPVVIVADKEEPGKEFRVFRVWCNEDMVSAELMGFTSLAEFTGLLWWDCEDSQVFFCRRMNFIR